MYEHLLISEHDGILTITLNRPEKLNSFIGHMRRDLAEALEHAGSDPVRQAGGKLRPDLVELGRRAAMRRPAVPSLRPATAGATKAGQPEHNLTEQGSVWVTTRVDHKRVVLTVENTGENLSPEVVTTLVEPFQRGTGRIRDAHAGVGLGLAIVKSIAQAHDGTITLTPRADGGLRVTVHMPAAPPPLDAYSANDERLIQRPRATPAS